MLIEEFIPGKMYVIPQNTIVTEFDEIHIFDNPENYDEYYSTIGILEYKEPFVGLELSVLDKAEDAWTLCSLKILTCSGIVGWIDIWIEDMSFYKQQ